MYDAQSVFRFHCICTFIQVVPTEVIKVVPTEYWAFKSLSKMSQEQAAEQAKYCTNFWEKEVNKKRQKRKVAMKLWLKGKEKLRILWNSACGTVFRR